MQEYDVLCIGNAIVDIFSFCEDDFLIENSIVKGSMNLIDVDRFASLQKKMQKNPVQMSGGSAGNTAAGIAALGGKPFFLGKVGQDLLGNVYRDDIQKCGVAFNAKPLIESFGTGSSLIFITPDGERSMNTYLGAATYLCLEDLDISKIKSSKIIYFEGYLWDSPLARELIYSVAQYAKQFGNKVAMTLSDSFCVDSHRSDFLALIRSGVVDIVFANMYEIESLYQTSSLETALDLIRQDCPLSVITRSEKGSIIIEKNTTIPIEAHCHSDVIDTTGAGDLYAAGFLFGYTQGYDLHMCGSLASFMAGLIITQQGSRLSKESLHSLMNSSFPIDFFTKNAE